MSTYLDDQAHAAADELGDGVEASITFRHHGAILRAASSNARAERCDQVEAQMDEGPCVDAMAGLEPVTVLDVRQERRWSRWSARTAQEGFLACVAMPAPVATGTAVAVNYYLEMPGTWAAGHQEVAGVRARTVAGEMRERLDAGRAPEASEDELGLDDQAVVEQAAGMMMQANAIDAAQAHRLLAQAAAAGGVAPVEVARTVLSVLSRRSRTVA